MKGKKCDTQKIKKAALKQCKIKFVSNEQVSNKM